MSQVPPKPEMCDAGALIDPENSACLVVNRQRTHESHILSPCKCRLLHEGLTSDVEWGQDWGVSVAHYALRIVPFATPALSARRSDSLGRPHVRVAWLSFRQSVGHGTWNLRML